MKSKKVKKFEPILGRDFEEKLDAAVKRLDPWYIPPEQRRKRFGSIRKLH